jgi:hypothetical protein
MPGEPLAIHPCRQQCCWRPTSRQREGEPLFACTSCGSEWVPSQPWTPVDQDGTRHASLTRALDAATPE